jgi:hypothetical protein
VALLALARAHFHGLSDLFAATRGEWQRDRERLGRASADPAHQSDAP